MFAVLYRNCPFIVLGVAVALFVAVLIWLKRHPGETRKSIFNSLLVAFTVSAVSFAATNYITSYIRHKSELVSLVAQLNNAVKEIDSHSGQYLILRKFDSLDKDKLRFHIDNNVDTDFEKIYGLLDDSSLYSKYDQSGLDFLIYSNTNMNIISKYINNTNLSLRLRIINLSAHEEILKSIRLNLLLSIRFLEGGIDSQSAKLEKEKIFKSMIKELNIIGSGEFIPSDYSDISKNITK